MPPSRNGGFTLLELLVATAIFAVMAVMVHGGLISVIRSREAITTRSDQLNGLQMAFSLLQRDLAQALPRPSTDSGRYLHIAFHGGNQSPDFLEFSHAQLSHEIARMPMPTERVRYRFENNTLQRVAWYSDNVAPMTLIVVENVVRIQVRFLDEKRKWSDDWNQEKLPLVVELTLVLVGGEQFVRLFRVTG